MATDRIGRAARPLPRLSLGEARRSAQQGEPPKQVQRQAQSYACVTSDHGVAHTQRERHFNAREATGRPAPMESARNG